MSDDSRNSASALRCSLRVRVFIGFFSLSVAWSASAYAQCDAAGLSSLPVFQGIANPHAGDSKADLEGALQPLRSDVTPMGLYRRARIELALSKHRGEARDEAIVHLAQIVQGWMTHPRQNSDPDEGEVLYLLASALSERGDVAQGRQVFHRLIRHHPDHRLVPAAYLRFAEHYLHEGDAGAAGRFLDRVASFPLASPLRAVVRYLRFYAGGGVARERAAVEQALLALPSEQSRRYLSHLRRYCR